MSVIDAALLGANRLTRARKRWRDAACLVSTRWEAFVDADQILPVGVSLLNWQMTGMLLGGVFWGVLGDRKGRISVLFGSILLYSLANLANVYVDVQGALATFPVRNASAAEPMASPVAAGESNPAGGR